MSRPWSKYDLGVLAGGAAGFGISLGETIGWRSNRTTDLVVAAVVAAGCLIGRLAVHLDERLGAKLDECQAQRAREHRAAANPVYVRLIPDPAPRPSAFDEARARIAEREALRG